MAEEATMTPNILILGGGYAGTIAAARIARRGVPVTLVDMRDALVERIRLHQVAAGDDVPPVPYSQIFRNLPVSVVRAYVTSIDRATKRVITSAGVMTYDKLVYALGSESAENPLRIRQQLRTARSMTVVGGGLTGIETAAEIAERHPRVAVTLIDNGTVGAGLSSRARRHLHSFFDAHNVRVIENRRVERDEKLDADVVVWCTSFELSPIGWDAGLRVNERGQLIVDDHLRTSDPSIYAVGDAAFVPGRRMSCALSLPMGSYVADVLTGRTRDAFEFGFVIQCISLGRNDGIVQFVTPDDEPRETAIVGRPAAWVKELICRFTVMSLKMETRGVHYRWPQPEEAAA
jgi:NADH dehydrogenase FAD-containing subunit